MFIAGGPDCRGLPLEMNKNSHYCVSVRFEFYIFFGISVLVR